MLGVVGYFSYENIDKNLQIRNIPFSGYYDPRSSSAVKIQTGDGDDVIRCPSGSKVNIINAVFEVYDPYFQCTVEPSKLVNNACSAQGAYGAAEICENTWGTLSDRSTNPNKAAVLARIKAAYGGKIPTAIRQAIEKNPKEIWSNPICGPGDIGDCKIRDATAYLSRKCDGQESCALVLDSGNINEYFGPFPCNNIDISTKRGLDMYNSLPLINGRPSYAPKNDSGGKAVKSTSEMGYKVHGIYTCTVE